MAVKRYVVRADTLDVELEKGVQTESEADRIVSSEDGYGGEHDQDTPEKDKDTDQVSEMNGDKGKEEIRGSDSLRDEGDTQKQRWLEMPPKTRRTKG